MRAWGLIVQEAVLGVSREQAALLKPRFHITGSTGWINDPNGMFQNRDGMYHVFYQVTPAWHHTGPTAGAASSTVPVPPTLLPLSLSVHRLWDVAHEVFEAL